MVKVTVPEGLSEANIEHLVDQDLNEFNTWFANDLKNGNMSGIERAVIKTYLWYKLHPSKVPVQKT